MSIGLNPYLTFDGTAREAMTFYEGIFGGRLEVTTFGDMGTEGNGADKVMHARLDIDDGFVLMASDFPPGQDGVMPGTTNVVVSITGDDERIRGFWEALSEGATVTQPFERQMWGDEFGQLVDRYGISWMVNLASDEPSQG